MGAPGVSVFMHLLRFLPYDELYHLNLSNRLHIDIYIKKIYNIKYLDNIRFWGEQKFCRFLWERKARSPPLLPLASHQFDFARRLGLVPEEMCPAAETVTCSGIGDVRTAFFCTSSLRYGTSCPWEAPSLT